MSIQSRVYRTEAAQDHFLKDWDALGSKVVTHASGDHPMLRSNAALQIAGPMTTENVDHSYYRWYGASTVLIHLRLSLDLATLQDGQVLYTSCDHMGEYTSSYFAFLVREVEGVFHYVAEYCRWENSQDEAPQRMTIQGPEITDAVTALTLDLEMRGQYPEGDLLDSLEAGSNMAIVMRFRVGQSFDEKQRFTPAVDSWDYFPTGYSGLQAFNIPELNGTAEPWTGRVELLLLLYTVDDDFVDLLHAVDAPNLPWSYTDFKATQGGYPSEIPLTIATYDKHFQPREALIDGYWGNQEEGYLILDYDLPEDQVLTLEDVNMSIIGETVQPWAFRIAPSNTYPSDWDPNRRALVIYVRMVYDVPEEDPPSPLDPIMLGLPLLVADLGGQTLYRRTTYHPATVQMRPYPTTATYAGYVEYVGNELERVSAWADTQEIHYDILADGNCDWPVFNSVLISVDDCGFMTEQDMLGSPASSNGMLGILSNFDAFMHHAVETLEAMESGKPNVFYLHVDQRYENFGPYESVTRNGYTSQGGPFYGTGIRIDSITYWDYGLGKARVFYPSDRWEDY